MTHAIRTLEKELEGLERRVNVDFKHRHSMFYGKDHGFLWGEKRIKDHIPKIRELREGIELIKLIKGHNKPPNRWQN